MEVAPRVLAEPRDAEADLRQHRRRRGQRHAGDQRAVAGTVTAKPPPATAARGRNAAPDRHDAARNQATNAIANTGRGGTSTGAAVSTAPETMVPLSAVAHFEPGNTPLAVNHQGLFVATTISFNLTPGVSLERRRRRRSSDAMREHRRAGHDPRHASRAPRSAFQQSLDNQPMLILAALLAVYIVLGMLYESYIHPITILSTLPSAGVGALLALHAVRAPSSASSR